MALEIARPSTSRTVLVLVSFAVELLLFSYGRNAFGPILSPVMYVMASLLFTGAAWWALQKQPYTLAGTGSTQGRWVYPLIAAMLLVGAYPRLRDIFNQYPIDVKASDIIPLIEVYLRRFQNGQTIYTLITEFGYDLSPTYLPMTWLPFLLPDALNIDYRWLGIWVLGIGFMLYGYRLAAARPMLYQGAFQLLLPLLVFWPLLGSDAHILGHTVETMIIGYYFIMVAGVLSQSTLLRAVGLVLCLLSRFSFAFWVPFYLWLIYRHEGPKRALWLAGLVSASVLALYVIPFLIADWSIFAKGQAAYTVAALGEWQGNMDSEGRPWHLFRGLGLAVFFFNYLPGDMLTRINALRLVHVVASVGSVAIVAGWYWLRRHSIALDYRHLALLALKLNLTLFYAFIQVPYDYLLLLVPFISVWIILCLPSPARSTSEHI